MKKFNYLFLFLIAFCSSSCVKQKNISEVPSLEFKQYTNFYRLDANGNYVRGTDGHPLLDSADCIVKFKDGDGDIGNNPDDGTAPDFKIVYLFDSLNNGIFRPYNQNAGTASTFDTLYYTYKVPYLTPQGHYKSLEGEIKAKFRYGTNGVYYVPGHKTVKFYITLRDRAGHVSNGIYTDDIHIPQ